ncbi:glycine zipper domain-containing protein [Pseudomonas sp. CAU 1711]|uniref:glycine zipper domain-containing protein n=1 Tax=Pseudomonas sp. CAU 1711 TaxID=3140356 RepID=UPI00326084FF
MRHSKLFTASFVALTLALGGCASSLTGDTYSRDEARRVQTVRMGTIEVLRPVRIEGTKTPIGAGAGAVIGGIGGSSVGGGRGSAVAAVIGAVAGGLIGAAAEEGLTRTQGVEITVREDDGSLRAYVQEVQPNEIFRVGERVRILSVDGTSRVAH